MLLLHLLPFMKYELPVITNLQNGSVYHKEIRVNLKNSLESLDNLEIIVLYVLHHELCIAHITYTFLKDSIK